MTSRERVMAVFSGELPDRVPAWCGMSDEFRAKALAELDTDEEGLLRTVGDDFRRVFAEYRLPQPAAEDGRVRTIFGIEREGLGYGQPVSHPLADAAIDDVHAYPWPTADCVDVSGMRSAIEAWGGAYAILGGDWSPYWHDAIDMLGMENLYMNMYDDPALVDALLKHLVDYYVDASNKIFEAAGDLIDIFFIGNDFGSQNGPLLSPAMFERFLLPHLRRLIDLGHDFGLPVQLHCCGGFAPLIPLMIDAGLDALHSVQPSCRTMDLAELKQSFGDRIVFNGAVDSHHVLIEGDRDAVVRGTREVLEIMMPGGRYIGGASHDTILEETPVENVLAMFETIREHGRYA